LDAAEHIYRSCLPRAREAPRPNEHEVYGGLLKVLWMGRKYEAIDEVCRHGLDHSQGTRRVVFHADRARALMALGKMDEALVEAKNAVDFAAAEDRLYCRRLRAQVLSEAGQPDQAVADCEALLKEFKQPGDVRAIRHTLSLIYSSARNHAKAEEQLRLILQADPNDATANNDLGYQWADQGKNLEEAERLIRKAIDLDRSQRKTGTQVEADSDQDNAAYVDSLGWVLFRRGRLQEARQELEKAAHLPDGDDPVIWDHLGDVYLRLEEPARAAAAWKKALELYEANRRRPNDERYKELKQKLKLLVP
jgi:tetratricopeptide (TPR) repeat protein